MKSLKYVIAALILTITVTAGLRAEGNEPLPGTLSSLNIQLFAEVKDALQAPIFLSYSDKNMLGQSSVTWKVMPNGKIEVVSVIGENSNLNEYLMKKLSTKSLWTDPKYNETQFTYSVVAK